MVLTLVGPLNQPEEIQAVIDTGFTGDLMLPRDVVSSLGLPGRGGRMVILADGSLSRAESYEVTVIWDGQRRDVIALETDGDALVGMSLLYGHLMTMEIVDGGQVTIRPLP